MQRTTLGRMPDRKPQNAAWLGLVLMGLACLALLLLEIYQGFWNAPDLRRSRDLVVHTFQVITAAHSLERSIRDAEHGQRIFLLTRDKANLEGYRAAAREMPVLLARLRQMTADNPEQERRLSNLERHVSAKLAELNRTTELIESKGTDAGVREVQLNLAAATSSMDAIDGLIRNFVEAENALLAERQKRAAEDERETALEAFAATVLGLVIVALGGLLLYYAFAERVRQQQALAQAREALAQSQKMEALGQLTGGVAHDFNNLLTVIMGSIETLQRRLQAGDADVKRLVDAAWRGTERAASLTGRLLAFARRQTLDPKPLDANRLVAGVVDLLHRSLGEAIAVETVLAGGLWRISADSNQLESAVLNLMLNARDAMPRGGKLTVETGNVYFDENYAEPLDDVKPGQYVMIAVSDNGIGMTEDIVAKAFDPFFTTKEAGHGTGLGLSQVYGFIKQSGGHVKIYSEPGQGTTMKLYLPRLKTATAPVLVETRALPAGTIKESVLVVEDDTDVRAFATQALAELGYRVLEAAEAQSALQVIEREAQIDLLFTDVGLPNGVNGRQLADEARRRRPTLKVLYTTGYARNAIIHQERLDPGVELIAKPFTQTDLARRVRGLLDS
jgi:signal transduction histidine kinase